MLSYKNIHIIGTSHISIESIQEITHYIQEEKPEIIALELDKARLQALFHKQKPSFQDIPHLGVKGFLLNIIGHYIEKKLGKLVGVSPGDEMKQAVILANKYSLQISLIDQPIDITLKKLSKQLTWKEKFRLLKEILKALIIRDQSIKFDLRKVPPPSLIRKMIKTIKKDYPSVYNVLIKDRNEIMAKNLYTLINSNPDKKILAIMGAAHKEDVIKIIRQY